MRILITGSRGFLAFHLKKSIEKNNKYESFFTHKEEFDLTYLDQTIACLEKYKPDFVFFLAALQGGIEANIERPAEFFYKNIALTSNIFEASKHYGKIKKIIIPMGGCAYPSDATSPIKEESMWDGYPQKESAPFSIAKKMSIVASKSYFKQYGVKSTVVIPGNMYGEFDNFRYKESHVIPSLIRKFYENKDSIDIFGTGKAIRDFIYAGDVANIMIKFIEDIDISGPINISNQSSTSVKELLNILIKIFDFKGKVNWLKDKPEGQLIKIFDTQKMNDLGLHTSTSLEDGLRKTVNWFEKNYSSKKIKL